MHTLGVQHLCSRGGTGYASVNGASVSDFSHPHPTSVAVDAAGRVYVSDEWSQRVQVFDSSGAYLASIGGSWGQGNSQLVNPTGVAVDAAGNVYVADKDNQRIEKFAAGYPNWTQANVNGFGNVANTGLRGMTVFNGQLYAGTIMRRRCRRSAHQRWTALDSILACRRPAR